MMNAVLFFEVFAFTTDALKIHGLVSLPSQQLQTVQETCSMVDFAKALDNQIESGLLANGYSRETKGWYREIAERQCPSQSFISNKTLILNVGPGTTATRWVSGIMEELGFKTNHCPGCQGLPYEEYHKYDYLSDSIERNAYELFKAYPNAIFMMGMRDPSEWQKARCKHHHCEKSNYNVSEPCLAFTDVKVSNSKTQIRLASFFAWIKCIVPAERLYAYNLFETAESIGHEASNRQFFAGLEGFLQRHGWMTKLRREKMESVFSTVGRMTLSEIDGMDT